MKNAGKRRLAGTGGISLAAAWLRRRSVASLPGRGAPLGHALHLLGSVGVGDVVAGAPVYSHGALLDSAFDCARGLASLRMTEKESARLTSGFHHD